MDHSETAVCAESELRCGPESGFSVQQSQVQYGPESGLRQDHGQASVWTGVRGQCRPAGLGGEQSGLIVDQSQD